MQTFKGFMLSTMLLLLGIISLGEASAQGFFFEEDLPGQGQYQNQNRFEFEVEEYIGRYVDGQQVLPLRQILDLDQSARGQKLIKVELFATSSDAYSTAQLELNGRPLGFAQNVGWRYDQSIVFEIPAGDRVIGRDIQTLKLRLRGNMYVDKVVATLKDDGLGGGGHGPFPGQSEWVTSYERQRFFSQLPVKQALRLNRQHEGKILKSIVLKGHPAGQRLTSVQLVVGGRAVGMPQYLDRQSGQVVINLNAREQVEIFQGDAIKLVFDGEIIVTELAAELVEANSRELRIQVNQRISGERVFLDQLLRLAPQHAVKKFEKIIVRGRLAGMNSSLRACARGFTQGAACDHTNARSGSFELVLSRFEMQAADIFLMARGEAIVDEVILMEDKKAPHQYPR